MTRLASIVGVATVATLVLLSGCETAVKTDYVKKLAGTWAYGPAAAITVNPIGDTPPTIPVMRTVTVAITDGDGVNKGTFSLTVSDVPVTPIPNVPMIVVMASGSIEAKGDSELSVTISAIVPEDAPLPPAIQTDAALSLNYEHMDNSLKVSGVLLHGLGVTMSIEDQLEFTRQ